MKTVEVCKYCGSADIQQDANYSVNAHEYNRLDNMTCSKCGNDSDYLTVTVTVPDDFDIYDDIFELEKLQ